MTDNLRKTLLDTPAVVNTVAGKLVMLDAQSPSSNRNSSQAMLDILFFAFTLGIAYHEAFPFSKRYNDLALCCPMELIESAEIENNVPRYFSYVEHRYLLYCPVSFQYIFMSLSLSANVWFLRLHLINLCNSYTPKLRILLNIKDVWSTPTDLPLPG